MARNVFEQIGDIKNNVRRASFDWSHDNNFTTGLGRITPVMCELCPPNTSLRIKPEYGLQFMPMMFPVQTKMKSYLSFYRVPLRTLWKDYMNFTANTQDGQSYQPPYIKFPSNSYSAGGALAPSSLADYFGIPVTGAVNPYSYNPIPLQSGSSGTQTSLFMMAGKSTGAIVRRYPLTPPQSGTLLDVYDDIPDTNNSTSNTQMMGVYIDLPILKDPDSSDSKLSSISDTLTPQSWYDALITITIQFTGSQDVLSTLYKNGGSVTNPTTSISYTPYICSVASTGASVPPGAPSGWVANENYVIGSAIMNRDSLEYTANGDSSTLIWTVQLPIKIYADQATGTFDEIFASVRPDFAIAFPAFVQLGSSFPWMKGWTSELSKGIFNFASTSNAEFVISYEGNSQISFTLTESTCPYARAQKDDDSVLKISAYPFRAYEAIYNAYIRNTRNNPFYLNGLPTYNRWITNDDCRAPTTTPLELRRANWASDMYTTALQSPQQGSKAPLVGITTYTDSRTLENGHTENKLKFALVDEDGKKYGVNFVSNGEALKEVTYSELSADTNVRPLSSLFDLATSGISINDFRNVNAYQRYLELNQFRGFSYKEIVEGRFDVNVRYDALDMPEYLGGITRDVIVNPVTQTVETSSAGTYVGALGSQAGIAGLRGNTDSSISVFCDEESLVIGLLSVVPMPVYTQSIPKYLLYRDRLDSYNPEFDHIGYQPIYYSEITPVLSYVQNGGKINQDVFGYQRPWYEYVQRVDRAHGEFLTTLRNFLVNRVFAAPPKLGSSFTTISEEDVNNVFSVTETTDKILGQIHFDITAKLPISRVVVPKIE